MGLPHGQVLSVASQARKGRVSIVHRQSLLQSSPVTGTVFTLASPAMKVLAMPITPASAAAHGQGDGASIKYAERDNSSLRGGLPAHGRNNSTTGSIGYFADREVKSPLASPPFLGNDGAGPDEPNRRASDWRGEREGEYQR